MPAGSRHGSSFVGPDRAASNKICGFHRLHNLFNQPSAAKAQASLMAELAMWTIRNQDSLPTGPQNRKYHTKWARPHNWYAPYRHGTAPAAFIP